ncbi:LysE family transporter [Geofilum sp. OHC36d9]|uniref:LysE family transporter n=1 Tax=Geofilum sp. OHC36d9 TaxID=3458413 RepID=UPI0040337543
MLAYISLFFTSFIIAFSGAMMPGPLLTVTISESTHRGMAAGPLLITGHAMLEIALIIALILGLGPVFKQPLFFMITSFAGGAVMLWMAWGMFKSLPSLTIAKSETNKTKHNLLVTGAIMSLVNPYWIIWWATIGLGYIVYAQEYGTTGIIIFFLGHIAGDYIWYSAISTAVSKGRKLFTDKIYRRLIAVCGTFLVGFAMYLIVMAIQKL